MHVQRVFFNIINILFFIFLNNFFVRRLCYSNGRDGVCFPTQKKKEKKGCI